LIRIPIGIRNKPATINAGKRIYMKRPIYVPPKLKNQFKIISERMVARLKTARTAPEIDIQFLIDDGSFIYFTFLLLVCKV
jgi:hypothetical protein